MSKCPHCGFGSSNILRVHDCELMRSTNIRPALDSLNKTIDATELKRRVEEVPLCYDDGYDVEEESFIRGERHFKEHVLSIIEEMEE